jgi:ABC-type branched-subunit amino acid transport system ATPase component/predicted MFS family arabinose efflux permease
MTEPVPAKPTLKERIGKLRPSVITAGAPTFPLLVLFGLNIVDELDREAFSILTPQIRDAFDLSIQGVLTLVSLTAFAVLLLEVPLSHLADRKNRIHMSAGGAAAWGGFSVLSGLAPAIGVLGFARVGAGLGRAVNGSTHNSLLSDWYPPDVRPGVFAVHRAANSIGQFIGPLAAGALAYFIGWRAPFLIFAIPTAVLVVLALRLKDPVRGAQERKVAGASEEAIETEEKPASMAEAFRVLWAVRSIRRIWMALPIVAIAIVGLGPLIQLYYEEVFGLNELQRGMIAAAAEPAQIIGLLVGVPIATRLMRRDPGLLIKFVGGLSALSAAALLLLIVANNLWLAVGSQVILAGVRSTMSPGLAAAFSLAIPPRVRSLGFSVGNFFIIPALFAGPIIGGFADSWGMRPAMLLLIPILMLGSFIIASAGPFMASDINKVRNSTVAMSEVRAARLRGEAKLLLVKELDVAYGQTQVLFGVDFEVDEGEIIALLGTNGAGKSTLIKAISGLTETQGGAIIFDGSDMTYAPPNEAVARGVIQVPGGKGVFPGLTVAENMKIAGWIYRRDQDYVREATERVLEYFPVLKQRWDQPSGNLSGGEQQMLTLGMAFIAKPKLLMIDELSLGLAPIIVEQLLEIVKAIRDQGTTIILVEQSVNVALTVAETAYFMEKGEIRFKGPTSELLERGDILRSVFLEGAASVEGDAENAAVAARARAARRAANNGGHARPALQVRGLTKAYGGVRAVNDVSFDLLEGQIMGIIGPNGAGKTTVFDLISGFVPADVGRVLLAGVDVSSFMPDGRARLGLGRSFQDARLFPALTVSETIAASLERGVGVRDPLAAALRLPAVAESERAIAARVEELIELMGLGAFRDKFISELSTGSRRIVDLACIMAHDPKVLLFDEPSSGIAQKETEALGPLLLRIREATGASLLVIEHDMPLITSISDQILALDLGAVVTQGEPDVVVHDPRVIASYLGSSEEVINRSGATTPTTETTA